MKKSIYKYQIDVRVLFIEDMGGVSVTNNIENILEEISRELLTSVSDFDIIYRDSSGVIDGIHTHNGEFKNFYMIGESSYHSAKLRIEK